MRITRTSPFSGKTNTKEIPVTESQMFLWKSGATIQTAMPEISADDREFILTGITPEEFDSTFGVSEEEPA